MNNNYLLPQRSTSLIAIYGDLAEIRYAVRRRPLEPLGLRVNYFRG